MSYIYAQGNGYSLTEDNWTVSIVHNTTGTDLTNTFHFDSNGVEIKYESQEDKLLLPGIVHSRCTVNTIWEDSNGLTTLIAALGTSQDGDYIIKVKKGSDIFWIGSLLVDEFTVNETSAQKEVRLVATDGISLLRNVDYNDAGSPYTTSQTVLEIIENINEKWLLYDYAAAETSRRFAIWEDVYNTDDYVAAGFTHPAGTNLKTYERSRIHPNPWKRLNDAGDYEYIDCYRILQSLCLSYQWRLFQHAGAWYFMPVQLNDQNAAGIQYDWSGTATSILNGQISFQQDLSGLKMLKGNEWSYTFSPQINEVTLHRDPNQGATVLSGWNVDDGDTVIGAAMTYEGADTADDEDFYVLRARAYVGNTAITIDDNLDLARVVAQFEIKFDTGADAVYYTSDLLVFPEGQLSLAGVQFGGPNFAPLSSAAYAYSTTQGNFYAFAGGQDDQEGLPGHYTPSEDGFRYVDFKVIIPSPPTAKTGLEITGTINIHNTQGQISSTLKAACTLGWLDIYVQKWSGDELELIQGFDYRATSTVGLDKIQLGTTHIGGLGTSMGRIQIETAAGIFGQSDNWVNQASSDERPINELCVEEILAMHTQPNVVERGSLVMRGAASEGYPFNRYYDTDTGNIYAAVNWTLRTTISELEVTFRKIGRNAVGITTDYANTGSIPRNPVGDVTQSAVKPGIIMHSYNNDARDLFAEDWTGVIGATETKEMYFTTSNDGQGRFVDYQGESADAGKNIQRTVYVNNAGLQTPSDSGWQKPAALQPNLDNTLAQTFELIRQYMNKLDDHSSFTFVITFEEVEQNKLLDDYSGSVAAYSLRKLRVAYTGNAILVRRNSDSTTQDIGFDSDGNLDTAALLSFVGNTASDYGYVHSIYDQTGNGHTLSQTSTSSQPAIVKAGAVVTANGLPAMEFDGSNDSLLAVTNFNPNPNSHLTTAVVVEYTSFGSAQFVFNAWNSSSSLQIFQEVALATGVGRSACRYDNGALARNDTSSALSTSTQYVITSHFANNESVSYYNGTEVLEGSGASISGADPNSNVSTLRIGARSYDASLPLDGYVQECVVWSENTHSNEADAINTSINDYYGAY